ncbi:hypothetical protein [Wohlfahrtiimonas populi]|uniref:hypothetical protein n=1 Tax=Wohlfahrtiimonas populi TaxID=1940240 RepID=UPI0011804BB3|nr:hypothetical protein [Wohlfahrtiimonas populi]
MERFRLNIISIVVLLLSWSVFVSPSFSMSLNNSIHHETSMQLMPYNGDSCNLQQPATNCIKHCEALSIIIPPSFKKELSPQNSPKLLADDQAIFQFYATVELKPPIK